MWTLRRFIVLERAGMEAKLSIFRSIYFLSPSNGHKLWESKAAGLCLRGSMRRSVIGKRLHTKRSRLWRCLLGEALLSTSYQEEAGGPGRRGRSGLHGWTDGAGHEGIEEPKREQPIKINKAPENDSSISDFILL